MGRGKRRSGSRGRLDRRPIPLAPVDLLAGLAPGVVLHADDLPSGIASDAAAPAPATTTVAETGKLIRSGDRTVRRLIQTAGVRPAGAPVAGVAADSDRAGVVSRTRDKPGE